MHDPQLNAAVAYYGQQPKPEDVPQIKAVVLLHYAGLDQRINAEAAQLAWDRTLRLFKEKPG